MMPDLMGYDRAITLFSPDGRLLQVEYAKEPVLRSNPVLALKFNEGVIIISYRSSELKKKYGEFMILSSIKKILKVEDNIAIAIAGILSDGYVLIDKAISIALGYRSLYGKEIPIEFLVRKLSNYVQMVTQWGGARPFGVSLIISNNKKIFMLEPSGVFFEYNATAMGKNYNKILNELKILNYNPNLKKEEVLKLGLQAIVKNLEKEVNSEEFEIMIIEDKIYEMKEEEIDKILKEIKK